MSPDALFSVTPLQLLSLDILVWRLLTMTSPHLIKILVFAGFEYFVSTYFLRERCLNMGEFLRKPFVGFIYAF